MSRTTVEAIAQELVSRSWKLGTAESCTGGLIASTLTDLSGSSAWFASGVVAYSNEVKSSLLAVPDEVLETHGAVSRATVEAMARGVASLLGLDAAVAVSGVAGPTGGTKEKPVGTVWIAWYITGEVTSECFHFQGDRLEVKAQTVSSALEGLLHCLD